MWSPCYIGNINKLESVQRMFTKRVTGMYSLHSVSLCILYIYICFIVYMYVFYGIVITCVLSCDSIKKFDDDDVSLKSIEDS